MSLFWIKLWSITSLVIVLLVGESLVQHMHYRQETERRNVARLVATSYANSLQERLHFSLSSTFTLAALVHQEGGTPADFDNLAAHVLANNAAPDALQLAPGGVVSHIYPMQGNEGALGHNLLDDPQRRTEALEAIRAHELTLAGPFELMQGGGQGLAGRYPVFLQDRQGGERFWGFTIALVKLDTLLEACNFEQLAGAGYHYELARIHPDSTERVVFAHSAAEPLVNPVTHPIAVPNDTWTLALVPSAGWQTFSLFGVEQLLIVAVAVAVALLVYNVLRSSRTLRQEIAERRQAEIALFDINMSLTHKVGELKQRTYEMAAFGEMGKMFQTCATFEEAYAVVEEFTQRLFPNDSGALSIIQPHSNQLEVVVAWGELLPTEVIFPCESCPALRHRQPYVVDNYTHEPHCPNTHPTPGDSYMCVPMIAVGEALGTLCIQLDPSIATLPEHERMRLIDARQRLGVALAEHVGLALSNLRLRDTLRSQSIRDALTGLYNRRYLDEMLARELHRVARGHGSLGVVMLDLDHFKQFNDTYGHLAGDQMLQTMATFLQSHTRAGDIACRYGGEEFTLIFADASLHDTYHRAEELRQAANQLHVQHDNHTLGPVTLSVGIAMFPDHGTTAHALLEAADTALYRAKANGRNRVVVAGERYQTINGQ
jgi:diguanylate cyclase (GGDEF)-like protein